MCHSSRDDQTVRKQIRLAGIQGLQVKICFILFSYFFMKYSFLFDLLKKKLSTYTLFGKLRNTIRSRERTVIVI